MSLVQQVMTGGEFSSEGDAWEAFDRIVLANKTFRMHREVRGDYVQPRPDTDDQGARIDRILIPMPSAVEAGWVYGAIGVEGKKSGTKVGKLISQAMDYTRCAFELQANPPGLLLMVKWVFIYPVERITGDLESLMAQNRIGYVHCYNRGLRFGCGGQNALKLFDTELIEVASDLPMGRKRGNRG